MIWRPAGSRQPGILRARSPPTDYRDSRTVRSRRFGPAHSQLCHYEFVSVGHWISWTLSASKPSSATISRARQIVRERESSGSRGRSCLELAIGVVELNEPTGEPRFLDGAAARVPVGVIPAGESSESLPELLDGEVRADGGSQRIQLVECRASARGQDPLWPTGWALMLVECAAEPEALRAAAGELRINRVEMRGARIAQVAQPRRQTRTRKPEPSERVRAVVQVWRLTRVRKSAACRRGPPRKSPRLPCLGNRQIAPDIEPRDQHCVSAARPGISVRHPACIPLGLC